MHLTRSLLMTFSFPAMSARRAAFCIFLAIGLKKKVKRRLWVKKWLLKREIYSHTVLLKEISVTEPEDYQNYFRMNERLYTMLLEKVQPFIKREDTVMRRSISASEKLAVTLRYLATGRNFEDIKFSVIMSPTSVSAAVIETCEALIYVLQDYLKVRSLYNITTRCTIEPIFVIKMNE